MADKIIETHLVEEKVTYERGRYAVVFYYTNDKLTHIIVKDLKSFNQIDVASKEDLGFLSALIAEAQKAEGDSEWIPPVVTEDQVVVAKEEKK